MPKGVNNSKPLLMLVQPVITAYRIPEFEALAEEWLIDIYSDAPDAKQGFGGLQPDSKKFRYLRHTPTRALLGGRLNFQSGLVTGLLRSRPDAVFITANIRALSYWLLLIVAFFLRIPLYSHGQGLYRKQQVSLVLRLLYSLAVGLSTRYICYSDISRTAMLRAKVMGMSKVVVAENSVRNLYPVLPSEKTGRESGIMFIGRLRAGSNIPLLIDVISSLRQAGYAELSLHIVGAGTDYVALKDSYQQQSWINFYGSVYQQEKIAAISKSCFLGCYPGDAGLSVVHYMSMSLIPVVHNSFHLHMGPEPSYIHDNINGLCFQRELARETLYETIKKLLDNKQDIERLQQAAYHSYQELVNPSLGQRWANIMRPSIKVTERDS